MSDPRHGGPHLSLRSNEPTAFGYGWISGVLAAVLGGIGLLIVLCFHFPQWLTMPALRGLYPVPYVRAALHVFLVTAFLLGTVSVCLRRNKALGLAGIGLVLAAAMFGGSRVPVGSGPLPEGPFLGLDWFLLNLILYSLVYVPLERAYARQSLYRSPPARRRGASGETPASRPLFAAAGTPIARSRG